MKVRQFACGMAHASRADMRPLLLALLGTLGCSEHLDPGTAGSVADAAAAPSCGPAAPLDRCGSAGARPDAGAAASDGPQGQWFARLLDLPTRTSEARVLGCNLDGLGEEDNQLGNILAAMNSQGVNADTSNADLIQAGELVVLLGPSPEGLAVGIGAPRGAFDPSAAFAGEGQFDLTCLPSQLAGSAALAAGQTYQGTRLALPLAIAGGAPSTYDLEHVSLTILSLGDGVLAARLCGAIDPCALRERVLPGLAAALGARIAGGGDTAVTFCQNFDVQGRCAPRAEDCGAFGPGHPAPAGCIRAEDLLDTPLVKSLFRPDVTLDGVGYLSLGLRLEAVPARF